ncbi:MAG: ABC transporter ATP-binding protein [Candidatus Aenigmatarchaeota archaeon]|nr:MAG: ABC transporter ATP-binding protein [Candidatus Aenigmarchaeota archaeon]
MNEIVVKNIVKYYPDKEYKPKGLKRIKNIVAPKKKKVLDNVDFEIKKGEIFGLLGSNGAGKTSLMKMISGLMETDEGEIFVLGEKMPENKKKIAGRINGVFARANMWWELTGKQNLLTYAKIYGVKKEKAEELIDFFGLRGKENLYSDLYSTGEVMRFCLAKSFLNDPEILFLDEPTIGLDPVVAIKVREMIKKRKKKSSIILTTHNMEEADFLCDRVAIINKGRIIKTGTPESLKKELKKEEIFEVEFDKVSSKLIENLDKLKYVESVNLLEDTQSLRIILKEKTQVNHLMKEIQRENKIQNIQKVSPTLEDVFVHLVGK